MACFARIIRLVHLKPVSLSFARNLTSNSAPVVSRLLPQISLTNNPWIWQRNDDVKLPIIKKTQIDLPNGLRWMPPLEEPRENDAIELPTTSGNVSKEAARLIVIRRKKMKKHKLKKLRKRMRFEWAKRRQRRELKKEKAFQAILIQQCKEAEAFSAEKYVEERLAKFNEVPAPKRDRRFEPYKS